MILSFANKQQKVFVFLLSAALFRRGFRHSQGKLKNAGDNSLQIPRSEVKTCSRGLTCKGFIFCNFHRGRALLLTASFVALAFSIGRGKVSECLQQAYKISRSVVIGFQLTGIKRWIPT